VNARDERVAGDTPLGGCAKSGSYELVKRLLDAGADPAIRGWMSLTAVDRARKRTDGGKVLRLLEDVLKHKD
jgi:ankyrin repeat protein